MSDFTDGDFAFRNKPNKKDVAEIKAQTWLDDNKISYRIIGFNTKGGKIPSRQWFKLCPFLRKMPDILVLDYTGNYLLEVKGCQNNVHLKLVDLVEYAKWDALQALYIFIYSTTKDSIYIMSLKALLKQASVKGFSTGNFNDNDLQYISTPVENLTRYKKE